MGVGAAIGAGVPFAHAAGTSVPPFSPTDIADLWGWFDASSAASVRTGAAGANQAVPGDPVSEWRDISGNSRNIVQATGVRQPTLLNPSDRRIQFDGGDNLTGSVLLAQPYSFLCVFQLDSLAADVAVTDGATGASAFYLDHNGPTMNLYAGNPMVGFATSTSRVVAVVAMDDASSLMQKYGDSAITGVAGAGSLEFLRVGNNAALSGGMTGSVCELAIYSRHLTAPERALLLAYGAAKWP